MSDLIRRQDVYDILNELEFSSPKNNMQDAINFALADVLEEIEDLPSAYKPNNKVHLCNSCQHNYPDCSAEQNDVIFGDGIGNDNICCCAKYEIADRPSKVVAQITFDEEKLREIVKGAVERSKEEYEITDRPTGKWVPFYDSKNKPYGHKCSRCGYHVIMVDIKNNFCSNCGADMRCEEKGVK